MERTEIINRHIYIKKVVCKYPNLLLKKNKGERYRVSKEGVQGMLWLEVRIKREKYRLKLTGEVKDNLSTKNVNRHYVIQGIGSNDTEDQSYPVWYIPWDKLEMVIRKLDDLRL